jgi:hypothetical protein
VIREAERTQRWRRVNIILLLVRNAHTVYAKSKFEDALQKGTANCQSQLHLYQLYCMQRVSALVKSHHQVIEKT